MKSDSCFNPLTLMSDQDRISPYNINTISSRQVMRIKKNINLGDYKLIQYQILQTNITRTVCQTVRRITNEILGVKGLGNVQHSPLILSIKSLILHTEKRQGKQKEKGATKANNSL